MKIIELDDKGMKPKFIDAKALIFGDLHGSFRKLINAFIMAGFLKMSDESYLELMEYFKEDDSLNIEIILNESWCQSDVKLVLLGDVFGDRNPEDILKLMTLKMLRVKQPKNDLSIMFGNHDSGGLNILRDEEIHYSPCNSDFSFLRYNQKEELLREYRKILIKYYNLAIVLDGKYFLSHAPIKSKFAKLFNFTSIDEFVDYLNYLFRKEVFRGVHTNQDARLVEAIWMRYNPQANYLKALFPQLEAQICGHDSFDPIDEHNYLISLDNMNYKIIGRPDVERVICL